MRTSRGLRNSPALLLTAAAVGLGLWVAYDLLVPPTPRPLFPDVLQTQSLRRDIPAPPSPVEEVAARRPPPSATVLPKLKPGMTRVEVETLLGPPGADDVFPVVTADGRTTYRMAYELADPDAPPTIRPLTAGRTRFPPPPLEVREVRVIRSFVALEFDATVPGHPLVHIHYLDPLF